MWTLLFALLVSCAVAVEVAPLSCRDPLHCHYVKPLSDEEHRYNVDGNNFEIMYRKIEGYLWMNCIEPTVLESKAMPRADIELFSWKIVLTNCKLPAAGSIVDRLKWLNITVLLDKTEKIRTQNMLVLESPPPLSRLTIEHFQGLERLASLEIHGFAHNGVTTERNFLSQLKNLRELKFRYLKIHADELNVTRPFLEKIVLLYTDVTRLPEVVCTSDTLLEIRITSDVAFDMVALPPRLRILDIISSATTLQLISAPTLKDISLTNWKDTPIQPLTSCYNLQKVYLTSPAAHSLPDRWLANCSNLVLLQVTEAKYLTTLPRRLFGISGPVKHITFESGVLETISEGQFDEDGDSSQLLYLNLCNNRLRNIPKATLSSRLEYLDLSSNDLDSSVLEVIAASDKLETLRLNNNPRLGNVCDRNGYSPIRALGSLQRLFLHNTGVSRPCRDWRHSMPLLKELDLRNTSISTLTFEDLQFTTEVLSEVLLEGAPLNMLEITRDDFEKAKHMPFIGAKVKFGVSTRFPCDCRMYWTRRILGSSPRALDHLPALRCSDGMLLSNKMPEELVCLRNECAATAQTAPAANNCTCAERPDDETARDRQLLRVNCTGAALYQVPRFPPSDNRLYELLLADNQITDVHASDLDNVKTLDLRNNFIEKVDEETAARLGSIRGMLRLAGNRLDCDCSAKPLLQALRSRGDKYTDLGNVTCSDGTPLSEAPIVDCPPSVVIYVVALVALFTLVVTVITCLASRQRRFFVKAMLHRWGCLCCFDADEDDRRYDAFITFSHKDEDIVRELMSRLEPPYRLCLHQRDWVPGLRIPDQIVASVRESRRTVALVSKHFLASYWARVEFREAHEAAMVEARPRLVVVLLEEPAALELDDQLQRYIATHTYLRWGEPWFYHKLAVALPRPRRPQAVITSAPFLPTASRSGAEPSLSFKQLSAREQVTIPLTGREIP